MYRTLKYSREIGIKFWYEFDDAFNPPFNGELGSMAIDTAVLISDFDKSMNPMNGTLDFEKFKNDVASRNLDQELNTLADKQLEIMAGNFLVNENFSDISSLQLAFEDFGQGVLYDRAHDDERTLKLPSGKPAIDPQTGNPMIFRIHTMDDHGSYKWWHVFIRAYVSSNGGDANKWLAIDKLVALSSLIFSAVRPKQAYHFPNLEVPENHPQSPTGPGSPLIVNKYRPIITSVSNFEELDRIFWEI
jgi:hypothetical protein